MDKNRKLKLNLLPDRPVLKTDPSYYEFYHDFISPALEKLIRENNEINTIGLFGNWGTGKSTIIDNLRKDFKNYPIFLFDIWKYQDDPLRRTFLISLFDFVKENGLERKGEELPDDFLDDFYLDEEEREKFEIKYDDSALPQWLRKVIGIIKRNIFLFAVFGLVGGWWLSQLNFGDDYKPINKILNWVGKLAESTVYYSMIVIFLKMSFEWLVNRFLDSFDTTGKFYTLVKRKNALNSPEQFEEKFERIIEVLESRIIIIFDNVDRIAANTAIKTLSTVKTFFDPSKDLQDKIVFVVPCDSDAILERIKNHYNGSEERANEYLSKLFNVCLWTPEYIGSDIEDYIRKTIPLLGDDHKLLDNEKLYIVLNQLFGSNTNPREIKQFLNNLVATLCVAYGTEVRELIFANIPYMAKVLAIKQKFPTKYNILKELFFDPENIWDEKDEENYPDFVDFMLNTSTITTTNAEPFIYFKKPNQSRNLARDEEFVSALLSEDYDLCTSIVSENKENLDDLAHFVLDLYKKYKARPEFLFKIVNTFLTVVSESKLEISTSRYFNETADIIFQRIWNKYRDLDTKAIFKYFIRNTKKTDKKFRLQLIDKYTTAISSDELKDKSVDVAEIISELVSTRIAEGDQVQKIRSAIEARYSQDNDIISLFDKKSKQVKYISQKALGSFITAVKIDNYSSSMLTLTQYKEYIKELGLEDEVITKIDSLLTEIQTTEPNNSDKMKNLFEIIDHLLYDPDSLASASTLDSQDSLLKKINSSYAHISSMDQRHYMLPSMYKLLNNLTEPKYESNVLSTKDNINKFIQQTSVEYLNQSVEKLSDLGIVQPFIEDYASAFTARAIANGAEEIHSVYNLMSEDKKQQVINGIIESRADAGLEFVSKLKKLPNRITTISKYLERASMLQPQDRKTIYNWVNNKLKINDDAKVKNEAVIQIKNLLVNDSAAHQEAAYSFLSGAEFLSDTQKREIGDNVLEWFRTPGKKLDQNHRYAILSVVSMFDSLDVTRKNYFVYELFRMLDPKPDRLVAEVAVEGLKSINIRMKDYQDYFIDFKENIKTWSDDDIKRYVIDELLQIRPSRGTKLEREYWEELEQL